MNLKNTILKVTASIALAFVTVSCDDDFNTVGNEIIGDVNFQNKVYSAKPIALNRKFNRVQTSNLPVYNLGSYVDPVYGKSQYDILTQIAPPNYNPVFGGNPVLDSVVLSIPYFNELVDTEVTDNDETIRTYELDSVYGSQTINLSIYRSNYFLANFDPENPEERKIYYSDDISNFSSLEGELLASVTDFIPSEEEIELWLPDDEDEDEDPEKERIIPQLRLKFEPEITEYFQQVIIDKEGQPELSNANNFQNYFRGIYIKTESSSDGNMFRFDPTQATITLFYTTDITDVQDTDDDGETDDIVRGQQEYVFTFSNNILNSISNTLNPSIASELGPEEEPETSGEDNLYLRGGQGSYAVLEFFNDTAVDDDGNPILDSEGEQITELQYLRNQEWLINEASIKLYVDQEKMVSGNNEPERIFIFDAESGSILVDYFDGTLNETNPINSVTSHLERLTKDSDENGEFYKIRLTQHIINILNRGDDNVKLGISVSQNVNITSLANGFTTPTAEEDEIIPFSSIVSHEGTILYGYGDDVPDEKRLKLEIFYTE